MTQSKIIRILLVDDHMVVRKGLALVLGEVPDMEVVGEAENGEEAVFLSKKLKPDIILMDVKMEGMSGKLATQLIVEHHQSVCIIGLSTFANRDIVEGMIDAGACGYLIKDISAANLTSSIRRIFCGEILIPDGLLEATYKQNESKLKSKAVEEFALFGNQQKKVLAFMSKGLTNPEIAEMLGVSVSTARYHVSAILRKLDVSNRSEAVAMAINFNLIQPEDF